MSAKVFVRFACVRGSIHIILASKLIGIIIMLFTLRGWETVLKFLGVISLDWLLRWLKVMIGLTNA
jgi:hypothetical protein